MTDIAAPDPASPNNPPDAEPPDRLGGNFVKLLTATVVSNLGDGMALIAYPWLATAVTRNPILIASVAIAQRLPWLIFTLPAGVITDRVDRRKAMVSMDLIRGVITLVVAFAVLGSQDTLPGPDAVDAITGTKTGLFLLVLVATLLLGMAEVLRDNSAQTILPNIVRPHQLEKANGRMGAIELVTNTFIGPPLGSLLLLVSFAIPFFVDSATFFVAAAFVFLIPGSFKADRDDDSSPKSFKHELSEGVGWLMRHPLLRPMAIILGLMNGASMITGAIFVLFAQEVLGVGPFLFTVIFSGAAIGGLIGGWIAPQVSRRLGSGTTLAMTLGGTAVAHIAIGAADWWPAVFVLFSIIGFLGILWNVITVSLRQTIIPARLLGRVNSVYRFFAWGMMPIGAAVGGLLVVVVERFASRDVALRSTWFVAGGIYVVLFIVGRSKLTTDRIEAARAAAQPIA